jgi:NAD(P)-dependent dehydrogenase (short-subunit alcohol dehydrogenase family)
MSSSRKTAIVTGASQGIGAGIVNGFVERGFNVVANSRKMTQSTELAAFDHVALVDGTSASRQLPPGSSERHCLASSRSRSALSTSKFRKRHPSTSGDALMAKRPRPT